MTKMITPSQQRKGFWRLVLWVAAPMLGLSLLGYVVAGAPGPGALLLAAAAAGVAVWLTRHDKAAQAGPVRRRVLGADLALAAGAVFGLLAAGKAGALGPVSVGPLVLVILGVAAHRLAADGSRAAAAAAAYRIAWRTRRIDAAVTLAAGLAVGAGVAAAGVGGAGLLAALVALAPVRWTWVQARAEQDLRAAVEAALAGVLTGGPAWTPVMANSGRAPIRRFASDAGTPTEIVLPLPPAATATRQEDLEAEVADRLSPFGKFVVRFSAGRDRIATVTLVEPLATRLMYDGRAAVDGTKVWIGTGMATREHRHAPGTPGIANGAPFDFEVDFRTEPHGIAVGLTGSGKSQTIQLVMTQLALAGWAMVLIDPKKVEFSQWVGRPGVLKVTTDLESHVEALEAARVEMDSRYAEMTAAGVNHLDLLPVSERPRRLLVVVDEVVELLSPAQGKTDSAKEANELKGRAQEAISSILRLGRAAGCHLLIAGQRADRQILTGEAQNNLAFKIIQGRSEQIERTMIGLGDVIASPGVAGRAVARTLRIPQSEIQVAYIDLQDLDRYVPVGGVQAQAVHPEHPDIEVPEAYVPAVTAAPVPRTVVSQPGPDGTVTQAVDDAETTLVAGRPGFTLDEVGGYAEVKQQLLDTVGTALADSAGAAEYGIQTGGVLLYGPPGTGKTHIAEALAGSLGVNWLKVSVTDLTSQWIGEGARKIEAAVDSALAASPCILLIDEIDGIAGRRDDETSGEGRKGVNALLVQLDRLKSAPGVVVIATTNDLSRLDPAVIRDGRFDSRVRIDLPDEAARVSILGTVLAGRPADPTLDVEDVAQRTGGYSAAMLTALINAAARTALADRRPIVTEDVLGAIAARGGQDRPTVEQAGLDGLVLDDATEQDLREVLAMLADPDRARRYGITPPSGLLLAGPPGTGKTSIAKALAAEAKTSFYAVSPGEWTSRYQGEAEKKVREVFERARANAPSIIFIDEIDAIATARGGDGDSGGSSRILTTLLAEMDGFGSAAAGRASVFVVAATNRPDVLDPALVRPGRLSRTVTVGLPNLPGRLALLTLLTAPVPLGDDVDLTAIAQATDGLSPADLGGVVQQAAMIALRTADGDTEPVVEKAAFLAVLAGMRPAVEQDADDVQEWLASLDDPAAV